MRQANRSAQPRCRHQIAHEPNKTQPLWHTAQLAVIIAPGFHHDRYLWTSPSQAFSGFLY